MKHLPITLALISLLSSNLYGKGIELNNTNTKSCQYLFSEFISHYSNSNEEKVLFKECESCCKTIDNDSTFVMLLLSDTSHFFTDTILHTNLKVAYNKTETKNYTAILGDGYFNAAFKTSKSMSDSKLGYFKKAYAYLKKSNDWKRQGYCIQNIAFVYEEIQNNNLAALQYAYEAADYWSAIQDTLSVANMYKYIGYLLGKQNQYELGKDYIESAIKLYSQKGFELGVAVSCRDLATLYMHKGNTDSALIYISKAKKIWMAAHEQSRIFGINNLLLSIYKKDKSSFTHIEKENNDFLKEQNSIIISDKLAFYDLLIARYHGIGNKKIETSYQAKKDELQRL